MVSERCRALVLLRGSPARVPSPLGIFEPKASLGAWGRKVLACPDALTTLYLSHQYQGLSPEDIPQLSCLCQGTRHGKVKAHKHTIWSLSAIWARGCTHSKFQMVHARVIIIEGDPTLRLARRTTCCARAPPSAKVLKLGSVCQERAQPWAQLG